MLFLFTNSFNFVKGFQQGRFNNCGVAVCQWTYVLLQLRNCKFTYSDANIVNPQHIHESNWSVPVYPFTTLISNGQHFCLTDDICNQTRIHMKQLISNLYPMLQKLAKVPILNRRKECKGDDKIGIVFDIDNDLKPIDSEKVVDCLSIEKSNDVAPLIDVSHGENMIEQKKIR